MRSLEEINAELEELANAAIEERIDAEYEEFLEMMYYYWECEQWERELELYDELG